jgi:hypothetical protein
MDQQQPFYLMFGLVGLLLGGLGMWFILADHPFESPEIRGGPVDETEVPLLAQTLADEGKEVDEDAISRILELHSAYFDGRIHDSLAAAEAARLEADRTRDIQELARRDVG